MKEVNEIISDPTILNDEFVKKIKVIDENNNNKTDYLFDIDEIYLYSAIKNDKIETCDKISNFGEDILLRQYCKAFITKDENLCNDNNIVDNYCTDNQDDWCNGNNWQNLCLGAINEDLSYCDKTTLSNCKENLGYDLAIKKNDENLCPKDNYYNLECKSILDEISLMDFDICMDQYYYIESKSLNDVSNCIKIEDDSLRVNCEACID